MDMELKYQYNKDVIHISETPNDLDVEFEIKILEEKNWAGMKELQRKFEENKVYTDVLFYPFENHHYRVIVRRDYYVDFILELLRHHLLESAKWI
ncbi:MAG: hypothetical protein WD424_05400 [Paenibacillaceae bacterium]